MRHRSRGAITSKHKRQKANGNPQIFCVIVKRANINGDTSNWYMCGEGISEFVPVGSKFGKEILEVLGENNVGSLFVSRKASSKLGWEIHLR